MSKTYVLLILPALLLAPLDALHAADAPKRADKPNIVIVLFDDMGWGQPQSFTMATAACVCRTSTGS